MSCPFAKLSTDNNNESMNYAEYLMLEKVLNAQRMVSLKKGDVEHDEHLFIIIHQTYELWFKQIIYDLDIARTELNICEDHGDYDHIKTGEIIKRLQRIVMILKVLVDQVHILETMSAMDFFAFRDYLTQASGFQSLQFRIIENKLGLKSDNRTDKFNQTYSVVFEKDENAQDDIQKSLIEPTLLTLVEKWLEHTPHIDHLWQHYKATVEAQLKQEDDEGNDQKRQQFATVFDEDVHNALVKRGDRKLSLKALRAGIIINLYKDTPIFAANHRILTLLIDIDSMFSKWRYNHMMMVQRMIGTMQLGTGGSSGYQYLRSTLSDRFKPFVDFSNIATFLIYKNQLLPNDVCKELNNRQCKNTFATFPTLSSICKLDCNCTDPNRRILLNHNSDEMNHNNVNNNYNNCCKYDDAHADVESSYESTSSSS